MSKLRILHSSDLHGSWHLPMQFKEFDLWVDSGDYCPNMSRGKPIEVAFQRDWLTVDKLTLKRRYMQLSKDMNIEDPLTRWYPSDSQQPPYGGSIAAKITEWLAGRPALFTPGNHDFVDVAGILRKSGAKAVNLTKSPASVAGLIFAGMREITMLSRTPEWVGESEEIELAAAVSRVMSHEPDVLVTHSPPSGILDMPSTGHAGISALTTWFAYRPHTVRLVLMGHVHEYGGHPLIEEMGITFSNSAQSARIIEIDI